MSLKSSGFSPWDSAYRGILIVFSAARLIDMLLKLPENKKQAILVPMKFLFSAPKSQVPPLVLAGSLYAVTAAAAARWAIAIHTPCKSNFEGGCGYGLMWAGILSFFAAWTAVGAAAILFAVAPSFESKKIKRWIKICAGILIGPPALYIGYCIWSIAAFLFASPLI